MSIGLKRAYEPSSHSDGPRILVERLWPRGVSKQAAKLRLWLKDLGPSTDLRQWFHARPAMWRQFRHRYLEELRAPQAQGPLKQLYDLAYQQKHITLVFGSRDTRHNSAVILKELLEGKRKPPSSSGPAGAEAVPMRAHARR